MQEITPLAWLALAHYLEDKSCVECGCTWTSRGDVLKNEPLAWHEGKVICVKCFEKG